MDYETSEPYTFNNSEISSDTSVSGNETSVSASSPLVGDAALTDDQFQTLIGDGDFSEFDIGTIFGFFSVSFVAGFLLASLIMVCRKGFTTINRILGKVTDT